MVFDGSAWGGTGEKESNDGRVRQTPRRHHHLKAQSPRRHTNSDLIRDTRKLLTKSKIKFHKDPQAAVVAESRSRDVSNSSIWSDSSQILELHILTPFSRV